MNENENITLDDMRASLVEKYGDDTTPEEPTEVILSLNTKTHRIHRYLKSSETCLR